MIKTRIIPILLLKDSSIVKSVRFENHRIVGDASTNVKVFSNRLSDEMMIVDIDAHKRGSINFPLIERLSRECVMPLTIGGGIRSLDDADGLFRSGADKVVVNTEFYSDPQLVTNIATKYGSQGIVFSLDVKVVENSYKCVSHSGKQIEKLDLAECVKKAEGCGAGEILLNSIDCDGVMEGFDCDLVSYVSDLVSVPVIAAGGCGVKDHCVEVVNVGASAVAAGSIFYWVGESIITLKEHMKNNGISVRVMK